MLPRSLRNALAISIVGVVSAAGLVGSVAPGEEARPIRILQMNLCGSGMAACYSSRTATVVTAVIRAERPDVVTLNETCQDDAAAFGQALEARAGGRVRWAFQPALNRRTGLPFRCRSGQPFGNAVIVRLSAQSSVKRYGETHPFQDSRDSEDRAWVCLAVVDGLLACTTHLANTSASIALAQCGYLFDTVIPAVDTKPSGVVVAGDLNLVLDSSRGARSCPPSAYRVAGAAGVQHVIVSADITVGRSRLIDLAGTTDHPALLVAVRLRR